MDPSRKRRIRLVVALSAAVVLAAALVFTSFNTSSAAVDPSRLMASAVAGQSYELTGEVVPGSIERSGDKVRFAVKDREGDTSVPITYSGAVPDPFRDGREVIVTVRKDGSSFVGERDSLVTKCPSKYEAAETPS
jgi:cytochrome c-type biogenesis protein CcmE